MQQYVYHMVPNEMMGEQLIPLNELKYPYPHLYEQYTKKYFDHPERPKLLTKQIPKMNCLWNDVLHFLPIHPFYVYQGLKSLAINTKTELPFYKIPIECLKENNTVIYHYSKENFLGPASDIPEEEIMLLNIKQYKELTQLPEATVEYWVTEKDKGKPFGIFPFIPHVLSHGMVDVRDVEIITWNHKE